MKLPGTRSTSEYLPTIWGRTIAFARIFQSEPGRRGVEPFLYYADLPAGRAKQTRGGTRGTYRQDADHWSGGLGPTGMDLHRDRLAFTWLTAFNHCGNHEPPNFNESTQPELWVGRLDARPRRLEHDCWRFYYARENAIFYLSSPLLQGRLLWYLRTLLTDSDWSHIRAYDLKTRGRYDKSWDLDTQATTRDGGTTYYTRYVGQDEGDETEVVRARAFTPSPVR